MTSPASGAFQNTYIRPWSGWLVRAILHVTDRSATRKTAYGDSVGQISAGINADQVIFSRDRDEFGGRIWRVRKVWSGWCVYSACIPVVWTSGIPVMAGAMRARAQAGGRQWGLAVGAGRGHDHW